MIKNNPYIAELFTKNLDLKRVLILLACLISVSFGEKTEWYIEFHNDDNTIHKIGRDRYNEAIELINGGEKYEKQYLNVIYNESLAYTELARKKIKNGLEKN